MVDQQFAAIILAAGLGTRMKSDLPKAFHPVGGRAMVDHVVATARDLGAAEIVVVIGPEMTDRVADLGAVKIAVQTERHGTADAVKAGVACLGTFAGDVLVAYGDTPLVRPGTYTALLAARRDGRDPAVAVLGFRPADPADYGRLIVDADGALRAIVESRDATPEQRAIGLCNSGLMAFDGARLPILLDGIGNDNAKGEFYLTEIVAVARAAGFDCAHIEGADDDELIGVNCRADLAVAEAVFQTRARAEAMAGGVTLDDPTTCYLSADTRFGRDVRIEPNVVFGPGVTLGDRVQIRAFCHITGASIGDDATIGPFARLRPGTEIGGGVRIGNFVEVKNARLHDGAKANHLSYIGDAEIGADANIGAGVITCNYDGVGKYRTEIGAGAFIGSNAALVAPVRIGAGAVIGAGSVIAEDVEDDSLATTRAPLRRVAGGAAKLRERNEARAEAADKNSKAKRTT